MFSMQGKRDNNEDRAVIRTVHMLEGVDSSEVNVWAVMDGHGGQVGLSIIASLYLIFSSTLVLC